MSKCAASVKHGALCSYWPFRLPRASIISLALSPSVYNYYYSMSSVRRVMLPFSSLTRLSSIQRHFTMNAQELKNFLADSPPSTVNLEIKKHFDALTDQQARYAHFISRYGNLLKLDCQQRLSHSVQIMQDTKEPKLNSILELRLQELVSPSARCPPNPKAYSILLSSCTRPQMVISKLYRRRRESVQKNYSSSLNMLRNF